MIDTATKTQVLKPGDSGTLTAELSKPGRYKWYCAVGKTSRRGR